jgi:hypothetical protein
LCARGSDWALLCGPSTSPLERMSRLSASFSAARLLLLGCLLGGAVALAAIFGGWAGPKPPLPPLLRNVSAGGGWWGACPPATPAEAQGQQGRPVAVSPELNRRLAELFPSGSSERTLVDALRSQGFELMLSCKGDHSIRIAAFVQHGGGLSPPMTAEIYWKTDEADNIVWTKGFVRYRGL